MAVQTQILALGSSSEQSIAGSGIHGVIRVTVRNMGTGVAYVGYTPVSTAAGFQLTSGDAPQPFTLYVGEQMYAYSTGTPTLHIIRTGDTT